MLLAWLNVCSGPSIHSDSLKVVVMHRMMFFFSPLHKMFILSWSLGSILLHHNNMKTIQTYELVSNLNKYQKSVCICLRCFKGKKKKIVPKVTWQFFCPIMTSACIQTGSYSLTHTLTSLWMLVRSGEHPSKLTQTFERFDKTTKKTKYQNLLESAPLRKHYEYRHGQGRS